MSNFFKKKNAKNGKSKNQQNVNTSNNYTKLTNNSSPPIYYNDTKAYEILDMWNEITNWNFSDFPKILEMANISLPITINLCDFHANKLICVDKDNVPFTITFKFHYYSYSKLFIEFENESFIYTLSDNNESKPIELILTEHIIRTYGYKSEIYTFSYNQAKKSIIQTLSINGDEFLYTVEYTLLTEESDDENDEDNDEDKKEYIPNYEVLNKILTNKKLCNTFENLKSSHALLRNIINNLNLTSDDLNELEISITFNYCDVIFSKIMLSKNVVTKLSFTTDDGYHNLDNTGKLVFTSGDKNITFVVKDISKCFNENSICIEDFSSILEYSNKMFSKIKNNDFLNN